MCLRQLNCYSLRHRLAWFGIALLSGLAGIAVDCRFENQASIALHQAGLELLFVRSAEADRRRRSRWNARRARRLHRMRLHRAPHRSTRRAPAPQPKARPPVAPPRVARSVPTPRPTAPNVSASPKLPTGSATAEPDSSVTPASRRRTKNGARGQAPAMTRPEVPRTLIGVFKRMTKKPASPRPVIRHKRHKKRPEARKTRRQLTPAPANASLLPKKQHRLGAATIRKHEQPHERRGSASKLPWAAARAGRSGTVAPLLPTAPALVAKSPAPRKPASKLQQRRQRQKRARRLTGFLPLPPHDFGSSDNTIDNEILVERFNPKMLKRVAAMGFKTVRGGSRNKLASDVVRLRAPAGANTAYKLLTNLFTSGAVHFNRRYRLYRAARGSGWQTTVTSQQHQKCSLERCYGPATVQWHNRLSRCAQGLRIGIIDTAVETKHPAFVGQNITTARIATGRPPRLDSGHGTGILALLAGNSDSRTPGLVPDASFYAADIFFTDGDDNPTSDSLSLYKALLQMEAWNVQVINLSLAGPPDSLVEKTIRRLSRKGIMFVAAGGNEGPSASPSYPAAYDTVVAVTAVDKSLRSYRYANRGDYIDVAAPGVNIWTAAPNYKDGLLSGTSLAAPFVTSIVSAVYRSLPRKSRESLLNVIATQDLGHPGKDRVYGRGLVRAPVNCRPKSKPLSRTTKVAQPRTTKIAQRDFAATVFGRLASD